MVQPILFLLLPLFNRVLLMEIYFDVCVFVLNRNACATFVYQMIEIIMRVLQRCCTTDFPTIFFHLS